MSLFGPGRLRGADDRRERTDERRRGGAKLGYSLFGEPREDPFAFWRQVQEHLPAIAA